MVLSLSPGETPLSAADHVAGHANMWRIRDDFWDQWPLLLAQFARLANWAPHHRSGAWPDADMLPLGLLALGGRRPPFTPDAPGPMRKCGRAAGRDRESHEGYTSGGEEYLKK